MHLSPRTATEILSDVCRAGKHKAPARGALQMVIGMTEFEVYERLMDAAITVQYEDDWEDWETMCVDSD